MSSEAITRNDLEAILNEIFPYVPPLIDYFYPTGSYYETSDGSFNPNEAWVGTTWILETAGMVHVSGTSTGSYAISGAIAASGAGVKDVGEESISYKPTGSVTISTHAITINEMPSHNHTQASHRHERGGNWYVSSGTSTASAFRVSTSQKYTKEAYTGYATPTINSSGGGAAHGHPNSTFSGTSATLDIRPQSIFVYRWHRIA